MSNLKKIKGADIDEQIKSADGLIDALDKKLQARAPDERLARDIAELKLTINALMDFLGLAMEAGPKKVIKRVRIADEIDTINALRP